MDLQVVRPILSGVAGGLIAVLLCRLMRRQVPEGFRGKDGQTLVRENRAAIWIANGLLVSCFVAGMSVYQLGLLPRNDWRGFAMGAGGGSFTAMLALGLVPLMRGNSPKEAYLAFAIAQKTPVAIIYGILILAVAAFAAAAWSLLAAAK